MKKLALIVATTFLLFNSALAKDFKVGDKMPDYKLGTKLRFKIEINRKDCPTWIYLYKKKGKRMFSVAHTDRSYHLPFAVYEFKSGTLYLDIMKENREVGHDGKIDIINYNPLKINIQKYNPSCKPKISDMI